MLWVLYNLIAESSLVSADQSGVEQKRNPVIMKGMNFKRSKHHRTHKFKKQELKGRKPKGWSYGGNVAREVVSRKEFRSLKNKILA